jgi:hypothetical protein
MTSLRASIQGLPDNRLLVEHLQEILSFLIDLTSDSNLKVCMGAVDVRQDPTLLSLPLLFQLSACIDDRAAYRTGGLATSRPSRSSNGNTDQHAWRKQNCCPAVCYQGHQQTDANVDPRPRAQETWQQRSSSKLASARRTNQHHHPSTFNFPIGSD